MVADRQLDQVFQALAHPVRREMLRTLARGEHNLSELAAPLNMTFPAASKHVRVLERARLVRREVRGRTHVCRLEVEPLDQVAVWTENCRRLWERRFAKLDSLLEELKAAESPSSPSLPPTSTPTATTDRKPSLHAGVQGQRSKHKKGPRS